MKPANQHVQHCHQSQTNSNLWLRLAAGCALLCVFLVGPQSLTAQVLYGSLTGNVADSTAAPIPDATVTAVNRDTGFSRQARTNNEGNFQFVDLVGGTYTLTVRAAGFGTFEQKNLPVLVNTLQRANAILQPGQVDQSIDVNAAAPALQTDKADTSYTIESQQLVNLPTTSTAGRNFQSLFKLVPGSSPPAESNSAAGNPQRSQVYNVNGVTNTTNTTRIDGAIDAFPALSSLTAYLPPPDGIDSINIVTGSFNAEQGSAGGAAVNVTIKSGTNQFHGSAWEYNSIAQFNAQSWQNRTGIRQKNIYNEYGVSLGGPILRDKLFFFADWNRVSTKKAVNGVASVPTDLVRSGDFSASGTTIYDPASGNPMTGAGKTPFPGNRIPAMRISSAAAKMISLLPGPTNALELNNFIGSQTSVFLRDNIDTKITYNPSQATSIFGHYSISPDTITDPQMFGAAGGLPWDRGQPGAATGKIQNLGLGATYVVTPHFILDSNAGYTRQFVKGNAPDFALGNYGTDVLKIPGTNNGSSVNYSGIPGFFFGTGYSSLGNSTTSSPFLWRDNQYTGNLNGTWVRGNHSYRFGGEYLHAALNHFQPGSLGSTTPRGGFTFSGGVTALPGATAPNNFNALADFLLGTPSSFGKAIQISDPLTNRYSVFSFFAQDTWQATHKLTLNYGARYEYYPVATADHYGIFRYDPSLLTTVTDSTGTHSVGSVVIGGKGGVPDNAGINNHLGMIVPRFGVAYRLNDATVIRSGFGITVDPDNLRSILSAYPGTIGLVLNGANNFVQAGTLATGIPSLTIPNYESGQVPLPNTISTVTLPKDYRRGYVESYNLTIQRQLPAKFVGTVAYVGTHTIRQQTLANVNPSFPGGAAAGRLLNTTYGANFNNTDILSILPFRGSVYNGLQTQLTRTSGRYIQFGTVYTFSKAMDISDNGQLGGLAYAYPAYWDKNWARAGYDRKHNFQFWSIVASPFGKGKQFAQSGVASWLAGGWQLSNILSRVSGTPFTVGSAAASLNAPGNSQFGNAVPGATSVLSQNTNGFRQYLNPAAFTAVTTANFGTAGRNSVRGPGLFNLDASLKRSFPIWRESSLTFQAEAFNVTNTPAFANPTATISTPATFGIITTSNSNRSMRLSGHITF